MASVTHGAIRPRDRAFSAGMVISRRAGYRPWFSAAALYLSLGFVALCALGAVLFVVAMLQGLQALSNF